MAPDHSIGRVRHRRHDDGRRRPHLAPVNAGCASGERSGVPSRCAEMRRQPSNAAPDLQARMTGEWAADGLQVEVGGGVMWG